MVDVRSFIANYFTTRILHDIPVAANFMSPQRKEKRKKKSTGSDPAPHPTSPIRVPPSQLPPLLLLFHSLSRLPLLHCQLLLKMVGVSRT